MRTLPGVPWTSHPRAGRFDGGGELPLIDVGPLLDPRSPDADVERVAAEIADNSNHRVRRTTPAGAVSTIAGATLGYVDGVGSAARFTSPYDLAVDAAGTVYVADTYTYRIRKIN